MSNPECWEQATFMVINTPFRLIATVLNIPLSIIWFLCKLLVLPLLLVLLVFNILWAILMAIILAFSGISKSAPPLRPISFILALPFLLIGDFIVTISPLPTPADAPSKMMKWEFLEKFPYGLDVMS